MEKPWKLIPPRRIYERYLLEFLSPQLTTQDILDIHGLYEKDENGLYNLRPIDVPSNMPQRAVCREGWKLTYDDIRRVIEREFHAILTVRDTQNGRIVGMSTLIAYDTLRLRVAYVLDIVIHPDYRGQQLSQPMTLMRRELARMWGVARLDQFTRDPGLAPMTKKMSPHLAVREHTAESTGKPELSHVEIWLCEEPQT